MSIEQPVALGLDRGPRGLDGSVDDRAELRHLRAQLESTACHSRDIEQVIQQERHVSHLPGDDLVTPAFLLFRSHRSPSK